MSVKILAILLVATGTLAGCTTANPPPAEALNVSCEPGGRHGPTGVLDYHCIDGDGEERLRPKPLHEVIAGAPIDTDDSR